LGVPFKERGRRMDEGIAMMRAVWSMDPVTFRAEHIAADITDMRMQPPPSAPIPLWIGGTSEAALKRAVQLGDGWHGTRVTPEQAAPFVRRLREQRPDPGFTISLRVGWDGADDDDLRRRLAGFAGAGIQHVMIEPMARGLDEWLHTVERVARAAAG
ncbi:MAG TPA: LLM class flavin-dependent oxidoreductase, partial [Candidatus Sulfotelmatobacter sp.]|nr:LLM class flavin-dependent oxidoreductase [Candidatus Sulfotelmatobacter sp.]